MDSQLKKIATATREEMESFARKHREVGCQGSDQDLSCYCAIASFFLVMVGKKLGYKLTLVEGVAFEEIDDLFEEPEIEDLRAQVNHCWVEYDGKIIDLSAMQFDPNLDRVHIVDTCDEEYWATDYDSKARKNMKKSWPNEQSPYTYIKELRKRADKLSMEIAA